jgi:hypothetical protein
MNPLDALFIKEGEEVPGACDRCRAYQTMEEVTPGVHKLTVHHADWCPSRRSKNAGAN